MPEIIVSVRTAPTVVWRMKLKERHEYAVGWMVRDVVFFTSPVCRKHCKPDVRFQIATTNQKCTTVATELRSAPIPSPLLLRQSPLRIPQSPGVGIQQVPAGPVALWKRCIAFRL
jgi:hypothetical protein